VGEIEKGNPLDRATSRKRLVLDLAAGLVREGNAQRQQPALGTLETQDVGVNPRFAAGIVLTGGASSSA